MPPRTTTGPDPAALAALQAESEKTLRTLLEGLKSRAAALAPEATPQALADLLREVGAFRERLQHDQRMGRLGRGVGRALQREIDGLGRTTQDRRSQAGRRRDDEREARAAHTMALPAAIQEFVEAAEAYDPFEKGRDKADAVQAARQLVQQLLDAGADPARTREPLARYDDARQLLAAKYKQREAVAKDNEAQVAGLILGLRRAMAEVTEDSPKEVLAVASAARRKVWDALRGVLLPRDIRTRLQAQFEPLDARHKEILDARHKAYLERKERRERLEREREERRERDERERQERKAERERELVAAEARLLHYAALYCSQVYAFDPAEAPRGEAARVRASRKPVDILLRGRGGRPSRVNRIVAAVRTAALDFEDMLETRRRLFLREGQPAEETGKPEPPPAERQAGETPDHDHDHDDDHATGQGEGGS